MYEALKNININLVSNIGKIKIDVKFIDKKYQKTTKIFKNNSSVNSVKENIFITSVNTK
jgi:hypothetical protein|tara:strand:- start:114 stop:290 length:177 start_codon:yes stop_codon:yes gene_type:complete